MKKKRALAASREPDYVLIDSTDTPSTPHTISFNAGGEELNEMLKITPDGFWVRGVRVPQDEKEAVVVYNAFKEWMVYSALSRQY